VPGEASVGEDVDRLQALGLILVTMYYILYVVFFVGFHGIFRAGSPSLTMEIPFLPYKLWGIEMCSLTSQCPVVGLLF
jgi:hypothetical protein